MRLAHLNRVQSPIINRARQDLAWQFPEVALVKSKRSVTGDVPLLWGWLANERPSKRYEKLYASTVGEGITDTVRYHAKRLCDLQREEEVIELELRTMLADSAFSGYREVFARFEFGDRISAVLLSQIYPLESYLNAEGKPDVKIARGRKSGKPKKRYLSLSLFQKELGVAPQNESSGDSKKSKVVGGSDLCRTSLWIWVFMRIESKPNRLKNEIGELLGRELDQGKANGRPVRLLRTNICAKAARLLFKELVKKLGQDL